MIEVVMGPQPSTTHRQDPASSSDGGPPPHVGGHDLIYVMYGVCMWVHGHDDITTTRICAFLFLFIYLLLFGLSCFLLSHLRVVSYFHNTYSYFLVGWLVGWFPGGLWGEHEFARAIAPSGRRGRLHGHGHGARPGPGPGPGPRPEPGRKFSYGRRECQ